MERDKVIDTIQKLLRLRDGTNSKAESESAAAKVQELLIKYNLEMMEVDSVVPKAERTVGEERFETTEKKNESSWIRDLYNTVANYNFCRPLYRDSAINQYGYNMSIIGKPANVEVVHYTVEWLIPRIRNLASDSWYEYDGYEKKGKFRRGFLAGAVVGVGDRLSSELAKAQAGDPNTQALVVVNTREVGEYVKDKYPRLSKPRSSYLSSLDGRMQGIVAGRGLKVQPGVKKGDDHVGGYLT